MGVALGSEKVFGKVAGNRWLFYYVEHPGINRYKGRGYLGFAMRQARPEIRRVIREVLGEEFLLSRHIALRKAFKGL